MDGAVREGVEMKLKGKIAVVVGGSQGIGASIAKRFAAEGARVAVVASSSRDKADAAAQQIVAAGGDAFGEVADVTRASSVNEMIARVIAREKRIDILVNSAGVFHPIAADGAQESDVERMIDINLKGTFMAIAAVVPHMKAARSGKIINIASVAGMMGFGGYSIYCATKAGVIAMTRALACELAPEGINVNAIAPGNTATPMNEDIRSKPELAHFLQAMAERTPSGRTYSDPEDMAALAAFLASDEARAMHGSTVLMDEGFSAGI
jgi:3-oxoacyl-[acyl-carrier protein] reductase